MKHLVVKGKVVAGDDVNAGIFLDLPVGKSKTFGLSQKVGLREVASPVFSLMSVQINHDESRHSNWTGVSTYTLQWLSSSHGLHPCGGNPRRRIEPS